MVNMPKLCILCSSEGKYKCPSCFVPYCSVTCFQQHKTSCLPAEKPSSNDAEASTTPNVNKKEYKFYTRDTVAQDKLKLLEEDKTLKDLLSNPHLRNLLKTIDAAENSEQIMEKAMQEPLFIEFSDACLRLVEPRDES